MSIHFYLSVIKRLNARSFLRRIMIGFVLGLFVIVVEVFDHYQPGASIFSDIHFIREVVLYGLLFPMIGITTLTLLEYANAEKKNAIDSIKKRDALSQRINETTEWEQLHRIIVQYPQTVLPVVGTTLLVKDMNSDRLDVAAQWRSDGVISNPSNVIILDSCDNCPINELSKYGRLVSCDYIVDYRVMDKCLRYYLPIAHSGRRLATLYLDFPLDYKLNPADSRLMNGIAPIISMALARGMLERSAEQLATINQADQERIAQDMHDTLAQNIAYLRLKLDQLSTDHVLRDIKQIRNDLGKMRGIADEAYQQVRGTLDILHINPMKEFTELVQEQVCRSQETTRIQIEFSNIGQAHPLTTSVKRQAFFICKEALINAINHSKANTINITVSWAASEMTVDISDDGCGFDPLSSYDGHYGLSIMRERAVDIYGNLDIQSVQDTGTRVTLKVPLLSVQDIGWPQNMTASSYNLS